jgi:hypothetical protein
MVFKFSLVFISFWASIFSSCFYFAVLPPRPLYHPVLGYISGGVQEALEK